MINHDIMKNENILTVLQCIQEKGPIYRKDIKEITKLSSGTISIIVNKLLKKGIIYEIENSTKVKGRNPNSLDIDVTKSCIIGIDINSAGIQIALMNLKCIIYSSHFEKIANPEADAVIAQVYHMLDSIVEDIKDSQMKLIGIGVAMQGNVSKKAGISKYCPYFVGWKDVPLKNMFETRYGCPVIVEHSPDCMALYENWFGVAKGSKNFVFIRAGQTIGISIVIDGQVLHGYNDNAGEFGHMIVAENGLECRCGSHGCLETVASQRSILKRICDEIRDGRESKILDMIGIKTVNEIDMEMVYRACCMGDELCLEVMNDMAFYLGIAISNVINLLNPELIVLGGDMMNYENLFIEKVRKNVNERAWGSSNKTIMVATNKSNTASIGACLNIMQDVLAGNIDINK